VLAQSCLWGGQYDCALKEFEQLEREKPDSAAVHIMVAEAFDGEDMQNEAIAELRAAAKISDSEPNVHFGLGYLLWKQRRDDEAEREFQLELKHDPAHAKAYAWLGDIALRRGDPQAAKPLLEKAVQLSPEIRIARLDLGIIYMDDGKNDKAIPELLAAEKLDPEREDAHYRLGRIYQKLGRRKEAQDELAIVRRLHEQKAEETLHKISGQPPALPVQ